MMSYQWSELIRTFKLQFTSPNHNHYKSLDFRGFFVTNYSELRSNTLYRRENDLVTYQYQSI